MDLLFPPVCLVCGKVVRRGRVTCDDKCKNKLFRDRYGTAVTPSDAAGRRLGLLDGVCASFVYREDDDLHGDAPGEGAARNCVLQMKFHGKPWMAREMALFMADDYKKSGFPRPDAVVPVPSYGKRSTNEPTALLARTMCDGLELVYDDRFLVKVRETAKQHRISRAERDVNLSDAFYAGAPGSLAGKTVLIVDDVLTSGNTLNECASACRRAGALKVYASVFAVRKK